MRRRIEVSRAALADFDAVYDFIAEANPQAAARVLRDLDRAIQSLSDQPKLGRPFQFRRRKLRLLTHRGYLIFYRERPDAIEIIRVIHGRRGKSQKGFAYLHLTSHISGRPRHDPRAGTPPQRTAGTSARSTLSVTVCCRGILGVSPEPCHWYS